MVLKIFIHTSIILMFSVTQLYAQPDASEEIAQVRIYELKSESRSAFHQLVVDESLPLLEKFDVNVSAYGPSTKNENGYYLVRTFENNRALESKNGAFYSSADWKEGPREAILELIDDYSTLRIPKDSLSKYNVKSLTVEEMDKLILSKLNDRFIRNFINEDVAAHEKIIHPDFVCINGDGTISNREDYMEGWATAYANSGYTSFSITDEDIRIFGDMALVRSKTVYTKEADGETVHGNSLYTDTYIKEHGEWRCVQAHITPVTAK